MTDARTLADEILKAAGSALKHYEPYSQDRIVAVAERIIWSVTAEEREACAKLMDDDSQWTFAGSKEAGFIFEDVRELAANAIRARGN